MTNPEPAKEEPQINLTLADKREANLLYQVLRAGNATLAGNGTEPEVLAAVADLLVRTKNLAQ